MNSFLGSIFFIFALVLGTESCLLNGKTWSHLHELAIIPHVETSANCLKECATTPDCLAFSHHGANGDFYPDTCVLFSELGEDLACTDCSSGVLATCTDCSEEARCIDNENVLSIQQATSELECRMNCWNTQDCAYYTWFTDSSVFALDCVLFSVCEIQEPCKECMSAPALCEVEEDICSDITYNTLAEASRNVKSTGPPYYCDKDPSDQQSPDWKGEGWYRMVEPAGTRLPEQSPGKSHCGTGYPGWLRGKHPTETGLEVEAQVCIANNIGNECWRTVIIKIRNCGDFYIYHLPDLYYCDRYCAI